MARKRPVLTPKAHVSHVGKLHSASLFDALPKNLFVAGKNSQEDPFGLGWLANSPPEIRLVSFKGLSYATAEGAVSLAVLAEQLRANQVIPSLEISFQDATSTWVDALRLDQLQSGTWQTPDRLWTRPSDCFAYPLRRIELTSKQEAIANASRLVSIIRRLPEEVLGTDRDEVCASVETVALEVLINIFQHAYLPEERRYLYAGTTVTPAKHYDEDSSLSGSFTTKEELNWLRENRDNMILEIALADAGRGIPRTLWSDAIEKQQDFAIHWTRRTLDDIQRAVAHHDLCDYAFHHDSTCKRDSDATASPRRLAWRGLHRCLRQTEYLAGSISLTSGQGKSGYVFVKGRMFRIGKSTLARTDFPGTLLTLRFPAFKGSGRRSLSVSGGNPLRLRVGYLTQAAHLDAGLPQDEVRRAFGMADKDFSDAVRLNYDDSQLQTASLPRKDIVHSLARFSREGQKALLVLFPFSKVESEQELLKLLPTLPPNHVSILLFCHIPDSVRTQLRAYSEKWSSTEHGIPRLFGLWVPDRFGFAWQIGGEFPLLQAGQKLYSDLENQGYATLDREGQTVHIFAKELARAYRDFLLWDDPSKTLTFTGVEAVLTSSDYKLLLNDAFRFFCENHKHSVALTTCVEGEAIRLPTGRLVTRFLSILSLLRSFPVLVAALSQRLLHLLEEIGNPSDIHIIADSAASYFVAALLLRDKQNGPRVSILGSEPIALEASPSVLFLDAIYRGDTLNRLAQQISTQTNRCRTAVACMDLRRAPLPFLERGDWKVHALLEYWFDPGEWSDSREPKRVYEVDAITHVPFNRVHLCEFSNLGATENAEQFLASQPDVFTLGFHRLAGQIHTVSLRTKLLTTKYRTFFVPAIVEEIVAFLNSTGLNAPGTNIVIFCRPQSDVYRIVRSVAEELPRKLTSLSGVFISHLVVAPTAPKLVFPRTEEGIMAEVHDALGEIPLFGDQVSQMRDFVGIYLEDASITGKSLQDFLTKVTSLHQHRPLGVLAFVAVNRLSPRETRFLGVCRTLTSRVREFNGVQKGFEIPFRLSSVFRLQVKTVTRADPNCAPDLIDQLDRHHKYFDERLRNYAFGIRKRIENIFAIPVTSEEANAVVVHPWYPIDTPPKKPSPRSIRLRHLLALNEQNEGVMSEVLSQITNAHAEGDLGVLSMLALEPHLLGDDPIPNQSWPLIRELCYKCLHQATATAGEQSDALAVLSSRPSEFVRELPDILRHVASEEHLVSQVAIFLLSFSRTEDSSHTIVLKQLDAIKPVISQDLFDWLKTLVILPERIASSYIVKDDPDAIIIIHTLIATTWTHIGLKDWHAFDDSVKQLAAIDDAWLNEDSISLGGRCTAYAERYLLPALAAMRYLASKRLKPQQADQLWESLIAATRTVMELRRMLISESFFQRKGWRRELTLVWNKLRSLTIKAASPVRIVGSVEEISSEPSVIEQLLPELYSSPFALLTKLALKHVPAMSFDAEEGIFSDGTVVVPVAKAVLCEFFTILLENMAKYAKPSSCTCSCSLEFDENKQVLKLEFRDSKKDGPLPGDGQGIPLMEEYARKGRFSFKHQASSETFHAQVEFSEILEISPKY